MSFHLAKTIASAASAGLVAGALAACSSSQSKGAHGPNAAGQSTAGAEAKNCCKGKNECKGKGQCATASHECAGMNECKGQGGCNMHCPK